jgi:hypothetical protein
LYDSFSATKTVASNYKVISEYTLYKLGYPGTHMEGPRKTTKNFSQESWYPGQDLNPRPPEYDNGSVNHSTTMFSEMDAKKRTI